MVTSADMDTSSGFEQYPKQLVPVLVMVELENVVRDVQS